jgi:hypothetical protein
MIWYSEDLLDDSTPLGATGTMGTDPSSLFVKSNRFNEVESMFKKNTAISYLPIGKFISVLDGSEVTTGTPAKKYTKDGVGGTLSGTVAYDATSGEWGITGITAAEMNGDTIGLNFTLADTFPIHIGIKTDSKIVSDLQDLTSSDVQSACDAAVTANADIDSVTDKLPSSPYLAGSTNETGSIGGSSPSEGESSIFGF